MLWAVYGHFQEIKKFNIIQSLVQSNLYTTATIVDILITESKGRNRTTYYYTYVCKDFARVNSLEEKVYIPYDIKCQYIMMI